MATPHPPKILNEVQDIQKLINRARYAQFGPNWALTDPGRKVYVQRIQALADILAEVTNTLEALITPPKKGR